jgi:glycosyltransferase involved in cell wall biosynthesis
MRIAILSDFPVHLLPGFEDRKHGYHATWLPPLAHELAHHPSGYDFHWITCTKEVSQPTTVRAWNQTFHLLPRWKLSVEMLTGFRRERRLISRLLDDLKPDFVHAWGTEQGYGYAAIDFQGPSMLSLQGILQSCCKVAAMPWLTRLQATHEARVLLQAKHLTVESPWGKSQLQPLAPHATIDLLEYGIDPACFEVQRILSPISNPPSLIPDPQSKIDNHQSSISPPPSSSKSADRAGSALPSPPPSSSQPFSVSASQHLPPKPLALFVGTLALHKGVDTLLAAFSDPRLRHVDLVVLGTGDPALTRRPLPPNIRLLGHRPPAEVRQWMANAWCLVHPTRADTSPNCVKEARVIGLPVVTTPNGGQTQYVEHLKSGFIHPADDTEGLIQGVLTVTESLETSRKVGSTGQAECRAKLTPAATAARLLEIYQTVRHR